MNKLYENRYVKFILPQYGLARDKSLDLSLTTSNVSEHEFKINNRVDLTNLTVYSVDPPGCEDADDAFSIYQEKGKMFLVIHIADPTENIDIKSDLWNDICKRIVTRYPSNRKPIHMMPDEIMEISSLMSNEYGNIKTRFRLKQKYVKKL